MVPSRAPHRAVLLCLSLLSGCAAARTEPQPTAPGPYGAYLIGRFAQDSNNLDSAAANLLRALQLDPHNPMLLNQAFLACLLDERPEAAALARQVPHSPIAQLLLGNLAAQAGDWQAARSHFATLATPGMSQYLGPVLVAWAQQGQGDTQGALATLEPKLTGQALTGVFALNAALIADLGNRYPQADYFYSIAQSNAGGLNLNTARVVANWQYRQGHVDDATEMLQSLGRGAPGLAIVVPRLIADLHTRPIRTAIDGMANVYLSFAAEIHQQNGDDAALALLRLALNMRPDLTTARLLMADTLAESRHNGSALRVLATIGNDDPLAPLVRLRRAGLEAAGGDRATAMAGLRQLAAEQPGRPEPLAAIAEIQRADKRFPDAIATYGQAIDTAPAGELGNWTLFFARAVLEQDVGRWPRAEDDLRHAIQLSPDQPEVLNFLGFAWADRNEHLPEARTMLARAAALRPNDGAIIDSLGWVMLRQGDVTDAVASLERAARMQPEDSEINGHLGDAYWAAGRKLQARYQWQLALSLKPEPAAVPRLAAKLQDAERETDKPRP